MLTAHERFCVQSHRFPYFLLWRCINYSHRLFKPCYFVVKHKYKQQTLTSSSSAVNLFHENYFLHLLASDEGKHTRTTINFSSVVFTGIKTQSLHVLWSYSTTNATDMRRNVPWTQLRRERCQLLQDSTLVLDEMNTPPHFPKKINRRQQSHFQLEADSGNRFCCSSLTGQ